MSEFSAETLESYRKSLCHSERSFAKELHTPYSTYRDWESGKSRIPGVVGVAVRLLAGRDKWVTLKAVDKAIGMFDRDYPHGIMSERQGEGG